MNKKKKKIVFFLIAILLFIVWDNNDIKLSTYNINNSKIPNNFNDYRIVQISDLHNKEFGINQRRLIRNVEKSNPDIIVITGDIVDRRKWGTKYMEEFIKGVHKIAPIYYVSGNHEVWSGKYDIVKNILKKYNVIILDDEVKSIEKNGEKINIIGIIDTGYKDREDYVEEILEDLKRKTNKNEFNILLSHRPEHIEEYAKYGYDLVFSGHAHGGQFRIPFLGGLYAPHQGLIPKYTSGKINMENTDMIVSRGLGNSTIPIRIFNRPEVTITILNNK